MVRRGQVIIVVVHKISGKGPKWWIREWRWVVETTTTRIYEYLYVVGTRTDYGNRALPARPTLQYVPCLTAWVVLSTRGWFSRKAQASRS